MHCVLHIIMYLLINRNTLTLNYYLTTNFTTTIPKLDFYFSDGNCVYMQLSNEEKVVLSVKKSLIDGSLKRFSIIFIQFL